jgi:probable rRNA maturation factor
MSIDIVEKSHLSPRLPYEAIQKSVLGSSYSLTLVFIGEERAKKLNKEHRQALYTPNVLSFPLDMTTGEIYIAPLVARREAHKYGMTVTGYIGYLFIHGLLHLKGYTHGATMEKAEKRYLTQYRLK